MKSELTFQEYVDEATRNIHSALLEGGGKQMRAEVWSWMVSILHICETKWPAPIKETKK